MREVWNSFNKHTSRFTKFFLVTLSHDSLFNYYQTNFQMMQHHQYSLTEIESMIPWERDIYINLLMQYLEEEKERQKALANRNR